MQLLSIIYHIKDDWNTETSKDPSLALLPKRSLLSVVVIILSPVCYTVNNRARRNIHLNVLIQYNAPLKENQVRDD